MDGVNGREFWRINQFGRAELIEARISGGGINPGSGTCGPTFWTEVDGVIYFSATDGTHGTELRALKTNAAPTSVSLRDAVSRLQEDASTTLPIRIAYTAIADDGLGINQISIVGPDAAAFEITDGKIFLKAGVRLHSQLKPVVVFQVLVDDPAVGDSPDIGVTGYRSHWFSAADQYCARNSFSRRYNLSDQAENRVDCCFRCSELRPLDSQ